MDVAIIAEAVFALVDELSLTYQISNIELNDNNVPPGTANRVAYVSDDYSKPISFNFKNSTLLISSPWIVDLITQMQFCNLPIIPFCNQLYSKLVPVLPNLSVVNIDVAENIVCSTNHDIIHSADSVLFLHQRPESKVANDISITQNGMNNPISPFNVITMSDGNMAPESELCRNLANLMVAGQLNFNFKNVCPIAIPVSSDNQHQWLTPRIWSTQLGFHHGLSVPYSYTESSFQRLCQIERQTLDNSTVSIVEYFFGYIPISSGVSTIRIFFLMCVTSESQAYLQFITHDIAQFPYDNLHYLSRKVELNFNNLSELLKFHLSIHGVPEFDNFNFIHKQLTTHASLNPWTLSSQVALSDIFGSLDPRPRCDIVIPSLCSKCPTNYSIGLHPSCFSTTSISHYAKHAENGIVNIPLLGEDFSPIPVNPMFSIIKQSNMETFVKQKGFSPASISIVCNSLGMDPIAFLNITAALIIEKHHDKIKTNMRCGSFVENIRLVAGVLNYKYRSLFPTCVVNQADVIMPLTMYPRDWTVKYARKYSLDYIHSINKSRMPIIEIKGAIPSVLQNFAITKEGLVTYFPNASLFKRYLSLSGMRLYLEMTHDHSLCNHDHEVSCRYDSAIYEPINVKCEHMDTA